MSPRNRWHRHIRLGIAGVAIAAFALATACGGDDQKSSSDGNVSAGEDASWEGAFVTPALEKPDFVLTDTSGKPFNIKKNTRGYVTLLYIGYLHCPDICPQHMADLSATFKQLPATITSRVRVVFVTADPDRDTPELIRKWLDGFNRGFIGLYGTQAQVDDFQRLLGIEPAEKNDLGDGNYTVSHAAYVMAFGTDDLAHLVYPSGITVATWLHDLPKLVKEGWKQP